VKKSDIQVRIKNIISALMEIPVDQIKDDSSPDTIEVWDSLRHINLVMTLEEEFGVQFSDNEIAELINVKLIIAVLMEKL
jgi:acyl carrier protein